MILSKTRFIAQTTPWDEIPYLSEYKATPLTSSIFRKNSLCQSRNKGKAREALACKAEGGKMRYLYTTSIYFK
jgi:hypothetical protein